MPKPTNLPLTCFIILFATLAITGGGGMIVVSLRQQIASCAQRLQKTEAETTRLERLNEELRARIAMLENPQALKLVATRLGMQPAKLNQYRIMPTDEAAIRVAMAESRQKATRGYAANDR